MVDKNLFLHDLAVVAIMKDEGHYIKEWLDYHLLAGVDHFYIYDNESTDNQAEVVKPYVEAGLVDYFHAPGKAMMYLVYTDAVKRFKFHCRYMAFIDGDEFIFPKSNHAIVEVVDEILSRDPNAAALAINWQVFGSNGQETADYSRGVLERFTRRAPKDWYETKKDRFLGNAHVKTLANPRAVKFLDNPHFLYYFEGLHAINENGNLVQNPFSTPVSVEKITIHHYVNKSKEEFVNKVTRGRPESLNNWLRPEEFANHERNDEFDDGILKYRAARAENFSLESDAQRFDRVTSALIENLSNEKISLEAALTCRALSTYLRETFPNDADDWKICEEASLNAVLKSVNGMNFAEAGLFIRELPNLLRLPYPAVKELRNETLRIIPQVKDFLHLNNMWKDYVELDNLQDILKLI